MSQGHGKAKRGIPSKDDAFTEWYPFIVEPPNWLTKDTQLREWMCGDHMVENNETNRFTYSQRDGKNRA